MYKFKYAVKNDLGISIDYSDVLTTYAAIVPAQLAAPTTEISSSTVKIAWVDGDNGGIPITGYVVTIKGWDGIYRQSSECSGTDSAVVS